MLWFRISCLTHSRIDAWSIHLSGATFPRKLRSASRLENCQTALCHLHQILLVVVCLDSSLWCMTLARSNILVCVEIWSVIFFQLCTMVTDLVVSNFEKRKQRSLCHAERNATQVPTWVEKCSFLQHDENTLAQNGTKTLSTRVRLCSAHSTDQRLTV